MASAKSLAADPGFSTDHRLMLEFDTSLVRYSPQQTTDFYRKLVDQTRALPGVRSATLARSIPFLPDQYMTDVIPEGYQFPKGQNSDSLFANIVDERYFDTLNVAIDHGRAFTVDDKDGSPRVAIVNQQFAKTYWPNQDAIGKRFHLNDPKAPLGGDRWRHHIPTNTFSSERIPRVSSTCLWLKPPANRCCSWSKPPEMPRPPPARCANSFAASMPTSRFSMYARFRLSFSSAPSPFRG